MGARLLAWTVAVGLFGLAAIVGVGEPAVAVAGLVLCAAMVIASGVERRRAGRPRRGGLSVAVAATVAIGAAAVVGGARTGGPRAEAWLLGAPVMGVHPMQHVGLVLDGFGPHDLVVPDHVEPQGSRGLSPGALAATLERQIHRVGEVAYPRESFAPWANGRPLAARSAWMGARVEVEPAEAEGGIESFRLRIVSGTKGPGASVRIVCPSSPARRGPRSGAELPEDSAGDCPRRYVFPGDAGLGLRPRWGAEIHDGASSLRARSGLEPDGAAWLAVFVLALSLTGLWVTAARERGSAGAGVEALMVPSVVLVLVYLMAIIAVDTASGHRWAGLGELGWAGAHARMADAAGIVSGLRGVTEQSALNVALAAVPVVGLLGLSAALGARALQPRAVRGRAHAQAAADEARVGDGRRASDPSADRSP